ncbi:hypothetical protein J416_11607 [Gracilibacillus halophilus YIM-C55.5]|uniref:DUF1934 domain-containing protein n=1 Tax=Gracilibacillus halophilus YIM-C55.5 TaxID=1308866 RepID=N4WP83_9BACI|nr:DUF1934 domain-containing protein [Gracilibacillus halophilus]ENH96295.1 hypothetical protein J416_11607 [Gracilibacillus halophilus YIM-C55.5]
MAKKTPIQLKMTTEIQDEFDRDVTVVEEKGHLMENGQTTILTFQETNENNEPIDSFITIQPESISVKRSGAVSMHQKFRTQQKTENMYRHQFGSLHMETYTDQIRYQPPTEETKGELYIQYTTSLNGQPPRAHQLIIEMEK